MQCLAHVKDPLLYQLMCTTGTAVSPVECLWKHAPKRRTAALCIISSAHKMQSMYSEQEQLRVRLQNVATANVDS